MDDDEKWYSASFVVSSTHLTPGAVQERLGIAPTRSHHVGDPLSPRNPTTVRKNHHYSLHSGEPNTAPMDVHLSALLEVLEPKAAALEELSRDGDLYFWCGFSSGNGQGGFALSPDLLRRLGRLGIELVLDLYPPESVD